MGFPYRGISRLPTQMDNLVWSISSEMKTNDEMVVPILLTILASIVQAKFEVHFRDYGEREYKIPLALYTLLVAEPGAGKSPIFRKLISPLDELIEETRRLREEENIRRKIFNEGIDHKKKMVKKAIKKYDGSIEEMYECLNNLEKQRKALLRPMDIYTTNCTSAGITRALAEQDGHRISIMDQEGSSLLMLKKDETLPSRLNHAFDHEKFSAQRATGAYSGPIKGIMSLLVCMQPAKYETLFGMYNLWDEGLLPRFLPFWGKRYDLPPLPEYETRMTNEKKEAFEYYVERIKFLFNYPWRVSENDVKTPHILRLSDEALEIFQKYESLFSLPSLTLDDREMRPWKSKAATTMIRIAAISHLYTAVGDPIETPITGESVNMAGELMESLIPNVEGVRRRVAPTGTENVTERVIRWLLNDLRMNDVSQRELIRAIDTSKQCIVPTIFKLLNEGVLREVRTAHNSPGRPASPRYIVNWDRLKELYLPGEPHY